MGRVAGLSAHLKPSSEIHRPQVGVRSPRDIVIIDAVRTPICRARKGALSNVPPEEMLAAALKGLLDRVKIDPKLIDDVVIGNVLQPGGGATAARMAALFSGIPDRAAVMTVNRQCSSGLQAVATVASAIQAGYYEIGIGGGVESMSMHYGPQALSMDISDRIMQYGPAANCLIPMGITSENVAAAFGVGRPKQDQLAMQSHIKAGRAQGNGLFAEEIVPVLTADGKNVVSDDGIRKNVTMEALGALSPAFKEGGSTTAGNSSQVSDGAAVVLLMERKTAERLQLPVKAKLVSFAVVGVPPEIMGIGPAFAIPEALGKAGISLDQVDIFEVNEAFASQVVYCVDKLGIPMEKLNPKGGSIALGHPLGATGARQIATILPELCRQKKALGVVSMCVGTGMGAAAVIESEQDRG